MIYYIIFEYTIYNIIDISNITNTICLILSIAIPKSYADTDAYLDIIDLD